MSQRTVVEINHDLSSKIVSAEELAALLGRALASGSPESWERLRQFGITKIVQLHHSDERKVVTQFGEYPFG